MSNENNLEQLPHNDEIDNSIYTNDNNQQLHGDEHQQLTPESDFLSQDDSTLNETVIVPGNSEFDAEYTTDSESSGLANDDSVALSSTSAEIDEEYDTEFNDESEIVPNSTEDASATPVDITIMNEDYTIFCPAGEEQALFQATNYINDFINGIRDEAPTLSHKNLLVLACLNLYEKMKQAQVDAQSEEEVLLHANRLVEQMIDDMQLDNE